MSGYIFQPPQRHKASSWTEAERADRIPGYLRRRSIIERRLMDAPPPLVMLRPTQGQEITEAFGEEREHWYTTDIEDQLVQCFFCRADGWLGIRQQPDGKGTRLCLNCYVTMIVLGFIAPPAESSGTVTVARKGVPRRPNPRKRR